MYNIIKKNKNITPPHMITPENIKKIILLLQETTLLNEEQKNTLLTEIESDKPLSPEAEEVLHLFVEIERDMLEEEIHDINTQITDAQEDLQTKQELLEQKSEQIKKELPEYLKKQEEKIIHQMEKIESDYEKKVEAITREQGEQSEIDAIHAQLLQKKKP